MTANQRIEEHDETAAEHPVADVCAFCGSDGPFEDGLRCVMCAEQQDADDDATAS